MKPLTRPQIYLGVAAATVLAAFGAWWYGHDPFRSIDRYSTYDSTAYYQAAPGLFETRRRQRTMFFKGVDVPRVYQVVKRTFPEGDGWVWSMTDPSQGFAATRSSKGDRIPESISGVLTSEGTVELVEFRKVDRAEEQMVLRAKGSDAFVPYPLARAPRPPRPETDNGFGDRFLNAG